MRRPSSSTRSGALYFTYFAALASLSPFIVLYFERVGMAGWQIGVLSGLVPAFTLIAAPVWTGFADSRGRVRGLLVFAALAAAATALLVPATGSFPYLLAIVSVLAFFLSPLGGLMDASVLAALGPARSRYGRLRSWGAVGWGLSAPLVGLLTQSVGLAWAFFTFGMVMTVAAGIGATMPAATAGTRERMSVVARIRLFANARWSPFLFAAFAGGVAMSGTSTFLYLRFAELGASESLVGLAITVATISEVPVFVATGWLLRRWRSQTLLLAALGVFAMRLAAYGILEAPLALVGMQLFHGASFALMWTAGVNRAAELAPTGMATTSQGVFNAMVMGLGSMAGALLGGVLYDVLGSRGMFLAFAALVVIAAVPAAWRTRKTSGDAPAGSR